MLGVDNMISTRDGREYGFPAGAYGGPVAGGYLGPYPGVQHQGRQPLAYDMYPTNLSQPHFRSSKELTGIPMLDGRDDSDRPPSPPPTRERFSYTRYQLELLNGIYTKIRYPNSFQKQLIAKRVGITRDQVKIWFQNRRRKDVIAAQNRSGNKSPASDESESGENTEPHCKMVPQSIMDSVIGELVSYENDPKGKKLKAHSERGSHRSRPYNMSSRRRGGGSNSSINSTSSSPGNGTVTPPMLSPHNSSDLSASSVEVYCGQQSPDPGFQSPGSTASITSPTIQPPQLQLSQEMVPISLQLDMVAPPNAVAPPSSTVHKPRVSSSSSSVKDEEDDADQTDSPEQESFQAAAYPCFITPQQPYPVGGMDAEGRPIPLERVFPIPLVADPAMMLSAMPGYNPCQTSSTGMMLRDPYQAVFMAPYNATHHQTQWNNKSYTAL